MTKATARALLTLLAGGGMGSAAHADRPQFGAFMNVDQIGEVQFSGTGDDVTYTEVSGNLTAQIKNRRIVASGSYRLSYRIPEYGKVDKTLNQDGVMRLQANVIEEWVTADAGVIITRARVAPGGAAPQTNSANAKNLTQTYSTFFQPTIAHHFGDLGFSGTYRYAYTKNEGTQQGLGADPLNNRFDSSVDQQVTATAGMHRGELPFDWTATLEYSAENATDLAKHTRSLTATDEVVQPLTDAVALVASGGYEHIKISQRRPLVNPFTGTPIRDSNGRFIVDPTSPRLLTYDMKGMIGDAGIIWKPSRRTRLEARAGHRYGGLTVTGLFEWKPSDRSGMTFQVTDRIETYGQGVSGGLAASPVQLDLSQSSDPTDSYQNCLFGKGAGTGRCIGGSLGQASASNYRERAASIIFNHRMRRWTFSASAGYSRRSYIDTPGTVFSLDGVVDQLFFGELSMGGILTRQSGVSFSFRANYFKNGQVGVSDVQSGSFSANYYRSFGRGIRLRADFSVDASKQDGITADVSGRAQLGLQYKF
jgi:hypothetical protein